MQDCQLVVARAKKGEEGRKGGWVEWGGRVGRGEGGMVFHGGGAHDVTQQQ